MGYCIKVGRWLDDFSMKIIILFFLDSEISLFQEGSMDSLYEPVPEQQPHQEETSGRTDSLFSPSGENGNLHNNLFMVSEP